ncbi:Peptidoglycan-associated lipoprotein [Serratia symbiotica]|nr:Peptidoglycan-associated lipoprotein [Serratia symbiotica]
MNKILKVCLLTLPAFTIISCNTNKNKNHDISKIENKTNIEDHNSSFEENPNVIIEELQKNNTIYFDLNKSDINSNFTQILDLHAIFLRNNLAYTVTIESYSDERGTPEYNLSLCERRANSIKTYLQSKGVSSDQISIISYGKEKPAELGHDEKSYAKNRRAVLVY